MAIIPLLQELIDLGHERPISFSTGPLGNDMFRWRAKLMGSVSPCMRGVETLGRSLSHFQDHSPYAGGAFILSILPFHPPKVSFKDHPYIRDGSLDILTLMLWG